MPSVPLKSRFGCRRCRERRRKCDETKPICGECKRLGFVCRWTTPEQASVSIRNRTHSPLVILHPDGKQQSNNAPEKMLNSTQVTKTRNKNTQFFDRPSVLRTHAVPYDGTPGCKSILQFLCERGTTLLRLPVLLHQGSSEVNIFQEGFSMAAQNPIHLQANLCMGAGFLSKLVPSYKKVALEHYTSVMSVLREELRCDPRKPPAEWTCAVAACLSFYELVAFHSPESRLAHLVGFHRLVELRLHNRLPWSSLQLLLDQYLHSLTVGSLFHQKLLIGQKSIGYVEDIYGEFMEGLRPRGPEVAGVPKTLTAVAYRLSFLNMCDVRRPLWQKELEITASKLASWTPVPYLLEPCAAGLLLIARLYQSACSCILQNIMDRTANATNTIISACLKEANDILEASTFRLRPFNNMVWPLTVLSIFAVDPLQQSNFEQPIIALAEAGIQGYKSVLSFLSMVRGEEMGPAVLQRTELLRTVLM